MSMSTQICTEHFLIKTEAENVFFHPHVNFLQKKKSTPTAIFLKLTLAKPTEITPLGGEKEKQ